MCKKDNIDRCKSGVEMVDYGVAHGGKVSRVAGSHYIVQGPTGGICPVPYHRDDLPKGTRCSIVKMFRNIGILMVLLFLIVSFWPAVEQLLIPMFL
jgi:predicted RNA binding protein YcfA (HicA-like mRNA interferase family)